MNKVILMGRLVKDPDIKYYGEDNKASMKGTLAVNRNFKNKEGNYDADFINISAFGRSAEFIEKYFHKGSMMLVEGEWRTGSYEKDGKTFYTNECAVYRAEFCGGKNDNADNGNQQTVSEPSIPEPQETTHNRPSANTSSDDDFINIDESATGDIPFFG